MINLYVNELEIPAGATHISTDWEVDIDPGFPAPIISSIDDTTNLTSISFLDDVDVGVTYYARCRMLLDIGYTFWSNVDVFIPEDTIVQNRQHVWPARVMTPTVQTNYPTDKHPSSAFHVYTSAYVADGPAKHVATHWVLRDDEGNVIWTRYNDQYNLTDIYITALLETNKLYSVSAAHVAASGNVSEYGSTTIFVARTNKLNIPLQIIPDLTVDGVTGDLSVTDDIIVQTIGVDDNVVSNIKWVLYQETAPDTLVTVAEVAVWTAVTTVTLDSALFDKAGKYILMVKGQVNGLETDPAWCFISFKHPDKVEPLSPEPYDRSPGSSSLPASLPYIF